MINNFIGSVPLTFAEVYHVGKYKLYSLKEDMQVEWVLRFHEYNRIRWGLWLAPVSIFPLVFSGEKGRGLSRGKIHHKSKQEDLMNWIGDELKASLNIQHRHGTNLAIY